MTDTDLQIGLEMAENRPKSEEEPEDGETR